MYIQKILIIENNVTNLGLIFIPFSLEAWRGYLGDIFATWQ